MADKTYFSLKLMLLTTMETARLNRRWGVNHDGRKVKAGSTTSSDYTGVGEPTVDVQPHL